MEVSGDAGRHYPNLPKSEQEIASYEQRYLQEKGIAAIVSG